MNIKLDANETHAIVNAMHLATIQGKDALVFGKLIEKMQKHFAKQVKAGESTNG